MAQSNQVPTPLTQRDPNRVPRSILKRELAALKYNRLNLLPFLNGSFGNQSLVLGALVFGKLAAFMRVEMLRINGQRLVRIVSSSNPVPLLGLGSALACELGPKIERPMS